MSRRPIISLAVLLVFVLAAAFTATEVAGERRRRGSISLGHPNKGSLKSGAQLPRRGKGFLSNQARPNAGATYGTDELIAGLIRAGADVERAAPGAKLYINDIGFHEGGEIPHHASHEAGRDFDLLFYQNDEAGKVAAPVCIHFDAAGKATWDRGTPKNSGDDKARVFDTRRNWLVVRSMVENERLAVQRIYVAEVIRSRLLDWARANEQPAWVIERAGDLMCQPGPPHDDHFHVRIFCSREDYNYGCRDAWPLYPWRRTQLAAQGLTSPGLRKLVRRRATKRRSKRPPRKGPGRQWCP